MLSSEESSLLGNDMDGLSSRTKILMGKAFVAGLGVMAIVGILIMVTVPRSVHFTPTITLLIILHHHVVHL
jgi:hypothetical protein